MEKITQRQVKWHPKSLQISQIPKEGLEYAFMSEDYIQIHQFVWCKDFMQDVIYASVNKKRVDIYGFSFDPKTAPPLYWGKTRLLLNSYKDANFGSKVFGGLRDFLHQIETRLKMELTVFEQAANPHPRYRKSGVFIVDGDPRWMQSPPMISLYTLLLRVGLVHTKKTPFSDTIKKVRDGEIKPYYGPKGRHNDNDQTVLQKSEKGLARILKYGDRELFHPEVEDNFPAKTPGGSCTSVFSVHDNFGMVGFSSNNTASHFPHWHRFKDVGI